MVATGPNASIACTASARIGSAQCSSNGGTKAPRVGVGALDREMVRVAGDQFGLGAAVLPPAPARRAADRARPAGPSARSPRAGLPTVTFDNRSRSAAIAASRCADGTIARRIAVHFWPAFTVISFATSLTNRSNSGVPGLASGARIAALSESRSATKRTASRAITGWCCSFSEVAAEPVNDTTS